MGSSQNGLRCEECECLDCQYGAAPVARKPYPSYAAEEATRSKQVAPAQAEAEPAPAGKPVARVEQVKSSTQFRLIWLQEPVEGVLYAAPAAPAPAIAAATGEQA
jgi:hypothetical protein